jgi:hypothetical protein
MYNTGTITHFMTKQQLILIIGIVVLLLPFIGFPSDWKSVLMFICGITLVTVYVYMRKERREKQHDEADQVITEVFVENRKNN